MDHLGSDSKETGGTLPEELHVQIKRLERRLESHGTEANRLDRVRCVVLVIGVRSVLARRPACATLCSTQSVSVVTTIILQSTGWAPPMHMESWSV